MRNTRARRILAGVASGLLVVGLALIDTTPAAADRTMPPISRPWSASDRPPADRAAAILAQMTLAEKVDLMTSESGPYAFFNEAIPRLGIPALKMADAGSGVAPRGWTLPDTGGKATALPAEIALGATWSSAQSRAFAGVVADEVRATGQNVLLGPDTDIARQPWFGRIAEGPGEDPTLSAKLMTAYVRTVQQRHVIATLKHYTGYNQETNRNIGQNSVIDQRTLHEVYALAFEAVIKQAALGSVMCSYNKINGAYSCQNPATGRDLLKGQLGFTGFVMTDFGALHDTLTGIAAGTDLEAGTSDFYDGALLSAVESGQVPMAQIDEAVLRILTTMFRIGLFDTPDETSAIPVGEHDAVARRVESKAITLLKNRRGVLPLTASPEKPIALIGADADILAAESGSSWVDPTVSTSTLAGLRARAGADNVTWTAGNDPVNAASMLETANRTTVPSAVLTPVDGNGTGLTAQYWHSPDFAGPAAVTRVDQQVNYDVGFASTFPGWAGAGTQVPLPPTNFFLEQQSVKYDGFLTAPATGRYVLSLTGFGDATMTLDGRPLIDMTGRDGRRVVDSATLDLTAGAKHRLHIDYQANRPLTNLQPGGLLLQWKAPVGAQTPGIAAAVAAAKKAEVAVVYARTFETEERDRVSLKLPQSADALISAVAAANPRTVVVLASGGPVTMPWIDSVAGVVQTYFGGQAQGAALADVLFGDVNPSGRLPLTYPVREADVPVPNPWNGSADLDVVYRERTDVGYKGYDRAGTKPLFAFGYGLSYTRFEYGRLHTKTGRDGALHVRFAVRNVGSRAGTETPQVYLGLPPRTGAPVRRLAASAKVRLRPGEARTVKVVLQADDPTHPLSVYDVTRNRWVTPRGAFKVFVGASARDLRLRATEYR